MTEPQYNVKCIVLGESSVGKTSLALRYVANTFRDDPENTVGASFMTKTVSLNSALVKLNIWDTAGQERYRSLIRLYYKDVNVAMLVYDITQPSSFRRLKTWYSELKEHCQTQAPVTIAIVANKEDLVTDEAVDPSEAKAYAKSIGALYYKTSCKTDLGVSQLFMGITQAFLNITKDGLGSKDIDRHLHSLTKPAEASDTSRCC
jgi:small GTP-binding protein